MPRAAHVQEVLERENFILCSFPQPNMQKLPEIKEGGQISKPWQAGRILFGRARDSIPGSQLRRFETAMAGDPVGQAEGEEVRAPQLTVEHLGRARIKAQRKHSH